MYIAIPVHHRNLKFKLSANSYQIVTLLFDLCEGNHATKREILFILIYDIIRFHLLYDDDTFVLIVKNIL